MKKYTTIILLLIATKLSAQTLSPTVISSSGAFYSNGTAMLSTTIAEMTMVETFTSASNFLTQGFQQPDDINVGIDQPVTSLNSVSVFPNPANEQITLSANFSQDGTLAVSFYNAIGQEVLNSTSVKLQPGISSKTISVKSLSAGIYFLKTTFTSSSNNKQTNTLKLTIVK